MSFSPNSRYLGFSLWSGEAYIMDMARKHFVPLPCSRRGNSSAPAFSDDSEFVTFGHNDQAYTYHLPDLRPVHVIKHGGYVSAVAFLGRTIYSGSWDGTVKEAPLTWDSHATCAD